MPELLTFLHIGKTGGTAARLPFKKHLKRNPDVRIDLPNHKVGLEQVVAETPNSEIAFFIREPVSRFISGFNSRLRRGWPRYSADWMPGEEKAFKEFKTPNSIAEALSSKDRKTRERAQEGLRAIRHTRLGYQHYLGSVSLLEKVKDKIIFIGEQESFDSDFALMKQLLGMDPELMPPQDDVGAHRTPDGFERTVSDEARANLLEYYAEDIKIYAWCKAHRDVLIQKYAAKFAG